MWSNLYVAEKLRELDAQRADLRARIATPARRPAGLIAWPVTVAGRLLRRAGEGLESWAAADSGCGCAQST